MVNNANINTLFKTMEQEKYQKELQYLIRSLGCSTQMDILERGLINNVSLFITEVNNDLPSISTLTIQEKSEAVNIFIEKNRLKGS